MTQLSVEDRGKIIGMHESGMSNCQISKRLGISKSTVAHGSSAMTRKGIVRERLDREESARPTTDMIEQSVVLFWATDLPLLQTS